MSNLSVINIDQQLAAIGIETTPAKMHIYQQRLMMKVDSQPAEMTIDRVNPTFRINRKKIDSQVGLKRPMELSRNYSTKSRSAAMRSLNRIVEDGNYLGQVKNPGNRVAQLSRTRTRQMATNKKLTIGLMPKSLPELEWDVGKTKIQWSRHKLSIDWEGEYMPVVKIDPPYSIEIFLRNKPYVRVTVEEGEDPHRPGRYLDEVL